VLTYDTQTDKALMLLLAQSLILCLIILPGHTLHGAVHRSWSPNHLLAFCPVLRVPIGSAGHVKQTDGGRAQVRHSSNGGTQVALADSIGSEEPDTCTDIEFNIVSKRCKIGLGTLTK